MKTWRVHSLKAALGDQGGGFAPVHRHTVIHPTAGTQVQLAAPTPCQGHHMSAASEPQCPRDG
ncbi:hypothetical protein [Aeromonas veronii]|uniref:hypothetical protein n=1 Tax=Aeromonas veronii TaxID=654 RepID=UPI001057B52B